jgi:hypothetical protein
MHTPGPWEVGGPYPSVTVITMVDPGCGGPDAEPPYYEPVAYIYDGAPDYNKPPPDVAIADARLIAAAPDLLAACQGFAAAMRKGERPELLDLINALHVADAAIAKTGPQRKGG